MISKKVSINFEGREYTLESGKYAKFASGSVMVSCGDSMVLVAATASQKELDNIDFLPLQVEYREKTASAGKIPGGFLKREGRPSDNE
ncbi:MAG: polyribonucleotide nucleotidyltransferase, partial [Bacteroidota bacterium]